MMGESSHLESLVQLTIFEKFFTVTFLILSGEQIKPKENQDLPFLHCQYILEIPQE